jgi:hypothetical protein
MDQGQLLVRAGALKCRIWWSSSLTSHCFQAGPGQVADRQPAVQRVWRRLFTNNCGLFTMEYPTAAKVASESDIVKLERQANRFGQAI